VEEDDVEEVEQEEVEAVERDAQEERRTRTRRRRSRNGSDAGADMQQRWLVVHAAFRLKPVLWEPHACGTGW